MIKYLHVVAYHTANKGSKKDFLLREITNIGQINSLGKTQHPDRLNKKFRKGGRVVCGGGGGGGGGTGTGKASKRRHLILLQRI